MNKHFLLLFAVLFSAGLVQAQVKKTVKKAAPVKKSSGSPAPAAGGSRGQASPSFELKSNEISGSAAGKLPPYRPFQLADSLAKFSPATDPGTGALLSPYIIAAPEASDEESFAYFQKMASELGEMPGIRNTVVKNEKDEILALAINNPAFVSLLNERKKYISIKTYVFPSLKALESSSDPWIKYLNREKALAKEISLQNTDYLPKTSEIKQDMNQLAP